MFDLQTVNIEVHFIKNCKVFPVITEPDAETRICSILYLKTSTIKCLGCES